MQKNNNYDYLEVLDFFHMSLLYIYINYGQNIKINIS